MFCDSTRVLQTKIEFGIIYDPFAPSASNCCSLSGPITYYHVLSQRGPSQLFFGKNKALQQAQPRQEHRRSGRPWLKRLVDRAVTKTIELHLGISVCLWSTSTGDGVLSRDARGPMRHARVLLSESRSQSHWAAKPRRNGSPWLRGTITVDVCCGNVWENLGGFAPKAPAPNTNMKEGQAQYSLKTLVCERLGSDHRCAMLGPLKCWALHGLTTWSTWCKNKMRKNKYEAETECLVLRAATSCSLESWRSDGIWRL